jgi:hypothetical protein
MGLSIIAENSYQHDAIYLADGPWGMDYNAQADSVEVFEVAEHQEWDLDGHIVERGVVAKGEVKETINIFRNILAGDLQLPIDDYQYLHFNMKNQTPVEISLVTDATSEWSERLRYSLDANAEKTQYSLSFSDFVNHEGKNMDFGQLRTIVISVQGDYQNYTSFELEVDQMALTVHGELQQESETEQEEPVAEDITDLELNDDLISILDPNTELELKNYPNPFVEYTEISLPEKSNIVNVYVVNLSGQVLYAETHAPTGNKNTIRLELGRLSKGMYMYQLGDVTNNKLYSGKIIRQ